MRFALDGAAVVSFLYLLVRPCRAFHVGTPSRSSLVSSICRPATLTTETDLEGAAFASATASALKGVVLDQWSSESVQTSAKEYAEMFGMTANEAGFFGLLDAMRKAGIAYGLKGHPFVLRKEEITKAMGSNGNEKEPLFDSFFTMKDLAQALEDDFLDAARGSTDNRKGWKVR